MQANKITVVKNKNYTTIHNTIFQNSRISLKARGMFATVMSLPPDWDFSVRGLSAILKESKDTVIEVLKELEAFGYFQRDVVRDKGRFVGYQYTFFESPCPEKPDTVKPDTVKPDTVKPDTVKPDPVKPDPINPTQLSKQESNKQELSKQVANATSVLPIPIPKTFCISPAMREWFEKNCKGYDIEEEFETFVDRVTAKGTKYKNWEAGWRTHMRNLKKYNPIPVQPITRTEEEKLRDYQAQKLTR